MLIFYSAEEGQISTRTGDLTKDAEKNMSTIDYGDGMFIFTVESANAETGEGTIFG
ncbi:MAG: hypothetical protein IKG18_08340 [Atopobiaceae bacterium]|nr:hypothetical protein [Atopobiaceae bacterium]